MSGYATVIDVQERVTGLSIGTSSKPNSSQIADALDQSAAELDAILRGRGYTLPIPTSATGALKLLEGGHAMAGAAYVTTAAPNYTKDLRDQAVGAWREFKQALRTGGLQLDVDLDTVTRTARRSPNAGSSMFTKTMSF